jgi:hypothetical protein
MVHEYAREKRKSGWGVGWASGLFALSLGNDGKTEVNTEILPIAARGQNDGGVWVREAPRASYIPPFAKREGWGTRGMG